MDDGQASTQPEFLTGYRRQRAQMPVGEPDKDECPVDARPGEREIHGGIAPARQAQQREPEKDNSPVHCCPGERPSHEGLGRYASDAATAKRSGAAQAARRARENARRRS